MKYIVLIFCVLSMVVLSGCATTAKYRQQVNRWKGHNINQLIDAWGYPNRTMKSPNGNEVYVYIHRNTEHFPRYVTGGYTTVTTSNNKTVITREPTYVSGGGTYHFNCTTWVEFDKKKTIVRILFRGNNCVAN